MSAQFAMNLEHPTDAQPNKPTEEQPLPRDPPLLYKNYEVGVCTEQDERSSSNFTEPQRLPIEKTPWNNITMQDREQKIQIGRGRILESLMQLVGSKEADRTIEKLAQQLQSKSAIREPSTQSSTFLLPTIKEVIRVAAQIVPGSTIARSVTTVDAEALCSAMKLDYCDCAKSTLAVQSLQGTFVGIDLSRDKVALACAVVSQEFLDCFRAIVANPPEDQGHWESVRRTLYLHEVAMVGPLLDGVQLAVSPDRAQLRNTLTELAFMFEPLDEPYKGLVLTEDGTAQLVLCLPSNHPREPVFLVTPPVSIPEEVAACVVLAVACTGSELQALFERWDAECEGTVNECLCALAERLKPGIVTVYDAEDWEDPPGTAMYGGVSEETPAPVEKGAPVEGVEEEGDVHWAAAGER